MSLPPFFKGGFNQAIATFDFIDIADGTGKSTLHGLSNTTSTGTTYELDSGSPYSSTIETSAIGTATTFTKIIDKDFDMATFNTSRTLLGTSTFQLCAEIDESGTGSAGDILSAYIVIKVRKWDGTTETEIASVQSQTMVVTVGTNDPLTTILSMPLEISSTGFKAGETLRVTVEGWGKATGGATVKDIRLTIGHDPINRDGTYIVPSTDDPVTITKFNSVISYDIKNI